MLERRRKLKWRFGQAKSVSWALLLSCKGCIHMRVGIWWWMPSSPRWSTNDTGEQRVESDANESEINGGMHRQGVFGNFHWKWRFFWQSQKYTYWHWTRKLYCPVVSFARRLTPHQAVVDFLLLRGTRCCFTMSYYASLQFHLLYYHGIMENHASDVNVAERSEWPALKKRPCLASLLQLNLFRRRPRYCDI